MHADPHAVGIGILNCPTATKLLPTLSGLPHFPELQPPTQLVPQGLTRKVTGIAGVIPVDRRQGP